MLAMLQETFRSRVARRGGASAVSFRGSQPEPAPKAVPATKLFIESRGKIRQTAADAYSSIALCLRRITIIARTTTARTPDTMQITITLSIFSLREFFCFYRDCGFTANNRATWM